MKAKQKIYASCESCGLAWTQMRFLPKVFPLIPCPECKKKTTNFDTENYNEGMKFISY